MSDLYPQFKQAIIDEQLVALATVVAGTGLGDKLLVWPDGRSAGQLAAGAITADVLARANELLSAQKSELVTFGAEDDAVTLFIEVHAPPPKLIMIGAVHAAIPLATFGKTLGFRTIVIDARGVFATEERFPHVDELLIGWPSEVLASLNLNESTCITFLTHDEKFDNPGLEVALNSPARYIGALGSTRTHAKRVIALKEMGLTDEHLARIYAPIGLDLGGRRPEEIATSIIAEIVAVMNGKA
ncbi:MAG: XdhC/CoxI family protein [Chloroflexota bacterium]